MNNSSICVLVSGGLDSDVLLAESTARYRRVWPIYIRQGLAWEDAELYWLKRFLKKVVPGTTFGPGPNLKHRASLDQVQISNLRVFSLPMNDVYGKHWSTGEISAPGRRSRDKAVYLPGRNLTLSVKAAVFCSMNRITDLAIGSLGHNPFPDASSSFFKTWGKALSKGLAHPIRISSPYRSLSKAQVIRRGRGLPLHLSFSCIAPKGLRHCGRCNKCAERRRAFKAAGVRDKTLYAKN